MPEPVDSQIPVYSPPESKPLVPILVGLMVLFLLFAVGFWLGKGRSGSPQATPQPDPGEVLAGRFYKAPAVPGQLTFIFFNDVNRNGVFDQNEGAFSNVSVELRRRGQEIPFQSVPADSSGKVIFQGLSPADYEVRFSYADYSVGISYGDFNLQTWYQIITPTGSTKPIPSDWEVLGSEPEQKIGVVEYMPDKLIVAQGRNMLHLIDPAFIDRDYGYSTIFQDDGWHKFILLQDKLYYLYNNELKQFDIKNRLTQTAIKPAYGIDDFNYRLSPDARTLIYIDNGELSYITKDDWCGQGAIFDADGYRILTSNLRVNFRADQQLNAVGRISGDSPDKVYLIGCHEGRLEAFTTDWSLDSIAAEPTPASWQQGGRSLDIFLGEVDL